MREELWQETWKKVPGFERYEVSDLGRVRSWKVGGNVAKTDPRFGGWWKLKTPIRKHNGYLVVGMQNDDGRTIQRPIHQLVLLAFRGERPAGMQACHGDGDKNNNTLANLRWATPKENMADRDQHGTTVRGEKWYRVRRKG